MKLSECTHGKLVQTRMGVWNESRLVVGMIVGITENPQGEPIPLVQWQHAREPRGIHPINIDPYMD
jgi:hypothetical protein